MDNGDNGDNLRQTYANALEIGGFSKTEALWITDAGLRAAAAGFLAMEAALDSEFRGEPPANVIYVCLGVLEARLAVMREWVDELVAQDGGKVVETKLTVSAADVLPPNLGTVQ